MLQTLAEPPSRVGIGERLTRLLLSLVLVLLALARPAQGQVACAFTLGFKALRDQIPDIVGTCLEDEHFNLENGNSEQRTTGGLLVWRKADNWTAFTDGSTTWITGPEGLVSRPNTGPLFPWEAAPSAAPLPLLPAGTAPPGLVGQEDVRLIALSTADLPSGFTKSEQDSKYEELPTGIVRVTLVFILSIVDVITSVVERYPDQSSADEALRSLRPSSFPAVYIGLLNRRDEDWDEVQAPAVGEFTRAFGLKHPTILILPDLRTARQGFVWLWARRANIVSGVGKIALADLATVAAVEPLMRTVDARIQKSLG